MQTESNMAIVDELRFPKTPESFLRACKKLTREQDEMVSLSVVESVAKELRIGKPQEPWRYKKDDFPLWDFLVRYCHRSMSFWACCNQEERIKDAREAITIYTDRQVFG